MTRVALGPHHDGSPLYVADQHPTIGTEVVVHVRTPLEDPVRAVQLRVVVDGEPRYCPVRLVRTDATDNWWQVAVPVHNPSVNYRFLLEDGPRSYRWLTALGVCDHDPTDATDFRLSTTGPGPDWAEGAVWYQIFLDRFAPSPGGQRPDSPPWSVPTEWDEPVEGDGPTTPLQLYGGTLTGIRSRLDHLVTLGVDAVYLTPFFPAASNHRYNAASFDHVDPLLGGDQALSQLVDAVHTRGLRVIGDLTTNHTGDTHEWFRAAAADAEELEAGFYSFSDHPADYATWFDEPTLPKLDHRSATLRHALTDGPDSVVARWLAAPFDLDGWRIDVANMTGRLGDVDVNHEVATQVRHTMTAVKPDAFLLAEHAHDATADLGQGGWHAIMNYAGFTKPLWSWLSSPECDLSLLGSPGVVPRWTAAQAAATIRGFNAAMPWPAVVRNLNLLASHDTARARTVMGTTSRVMLAFGVMMTLPGAPMIFAGEEFGLEGTNGEASRTPMPWGRLSADQLATCDELRRLTRLRHEFPALRRGALRWLHADDHTLVFQRELPDQRLTIVLTDSSTVLDVPTAVITDPTPLFGDGVCTRGQGDRTRLTLSDVGMAIWE